MRAVADYSQLCHALRWKNDVVPGIARLNPLR
jgi:hypothetical protein